MVHKINNNNIYVAVDTMGAQLRSVCDVHGTEYLWQGDENIWADQAPVLFPIIGAVVDNKYKLYGKEYEMFNHGFASSQKFKVAEKLSDKLTLRLEENSETLKQYPFKFTFDVIFELCDNTLCVRFRVTNRDDKIMPYAVGGHPGFKAPIDDDGDFEECILKFDCVETCDAPYLRRNLTEEITERIHVFDNSQYLPLKREMFGRVLILEELNSRGVNLYSTESGKGVRMDFEGFDNLGVWKMKEGNYLCLEPWTSPGTISSPDGDLAKRKGMLLLKPGETEEHSFKVTLI